MKKLLLVTGIFLSLSVMVSAQQKKSTAPATTTQTPQKKKTIKDMKAERTAAKIKRAEDKKKASASLPASKETKNN